MSHDRAIRSALSPPLAAEADFQKWWVKSAMSTMMVTGTPKA